MLNIRTIIVSVALVIILLLAVPLVTARTEVALYPSSDSVIVFDHQDRYDKMNPSYPSSDSVIVLDHQDRYDKMNPSYRSPLDECYDVPLREAASCRKASQAPVGLYRSPREVCFDAPLGGAVTCPIENPTLLPSYRSPLDVCYDVPLSAAAACRLAEQAPAR